MRWPWDNRKRKLTPDLISAKCPHCGCDLAVTFEQRILLADGQPIWPFCPICTQVVAAKAVPKTAE